MKNLIQDLIDNGTIEVESHSSNEEQVMFKDPFLKHDKRKALKIDKNNNYTNATYDYTINHITKMDAHVSTITLKCKSLKCNVTTQWGKVTIEGVTSKTTSSSNNQYDLVRHPLSFQSLNPCIFHLHT